MSGMRAEFGKPDEEFKWNKVSRSNCRFYRALVDYFFRTYFLSFHCVIVEKAWVNTRLYHDGSVDIARRKHFTQFLSTKIAAMQRAHGGRDIKTRIYVDKIASPYAKAGEAIEVIGNHTIRKKNSLVDAAADIKPIEFLKECDSKEYNAIQLCDLLLGAVVDTWNQSSSSDHKAELREHIASYLRWPDLRSDTVPAERKFNIWWLTDQIGRGQRRVKTRSVQLHYPLRPIRQYLAP